jgi:NAD(P)-dependent dehydrogenase (short-subunit alcohol dehydrogenase family)
MDYFKDKVAIITGGSRGVGFATAKELARRGAKVVITARGEKRLEDSKNKLKQMGADVVAVSGDVAQWTHAEKVVKAAIDNFGRLDILINNAGVSMRGDFEDLTADVCQRVVDTNLTGCILMSKAAIDHLIKSKGHLIFISSIAGLFGTPGASLYSATKGALTGFSESIRLELKPRGLHSGVVYLGFTENDPEKRILAADGSLIPPDRPAMHTQAMAADLIVKMIEKRKRRLIMTPIGTLGWLMYRLSPGFVESAILWAKSSQLGLYKKMS